MNENQKKYIMRYDSSVFLKAANIISVFSSLALLLIICVANSSTFPNQGIWPIIINSTVFIAVVFALVAVFKVVKDMVRNH